MNKFVTRYHQFLLLLVLLLAFALRIHQLDGQSMWSDEGLSLYRLRQPIPQLLQNIITIDGIDSRDTNPPLYFLLLHGWRYLGGETVFALRYGGVLLALLAVPLIYRLGGLMLPRWGSLLATFLLAISPFHVWQSQVLRNYSLLITVNVLAVYALFRFSQGGTRPWRWLLLWLTAVLFGSYTHYFGLFILAYGMVGLFFVVFYKWRRQLHVLLRGRRWVLAAGLGMLLLLPVLHIALERFRAGRQVDFYYVSAPDFVHHALGAFGVGMPVALTQPWALIGPSLLLFLAGGLWLIRRHWPQALLLVGYQLIPLSLLQLLSLLNPLYNGPRHLLIGLPPFLLLLAAGVTLPTTRFWRWAGAGLLVTAVAIQLNALNTQFTAPQYVRDDVRGAATYLTQHANANDLIVLHDTLISFTFEYYYKGAAPWRAIPQYGQQDLASAQAELAAAGAVVAPTGGRLWFLTEPLPRNGFPRNALLEQANQQWPLLWERRFSHMWLPVKVAAYVPNPQLTALPAQALPVNASYGQGLALRGVDLPDDILQAGAERWLPLFWVREGDAPRNVTLSLRFTGPDGVVWAQRDELLWPDYPPSLWPQGTLVRHDVRVALPGGVPPGAYSLTLRLVDEVGAVIPVTDGRLDLPLGEVQVAAGQTNLPDLTGQKVNLGPLRLLGYNLPALALRPGHLLPVTLFWQARRAPEVDYLLRLQLVNGAGEVLQEVVGPLTRADYPMTLWHKGEVVQGRGALLIPGTAVPDDIFLRLALLTLEGREVGREVVLNERPTLVPWPLVTKLPSIPQTQIADFGSMAEIRLHGYGLEPDTLTAGGRLNLTLYWQAQQDIKDNLLLFVHLSDAQEQVVTQADGVPVKGTRLTVSWRAGEVLVDERALAVPSDLPPGRYSLWVGFYDPETGLRLTVSGSGADVFNGRVLLATFDWEQP